MKVWKQSNQIAKMANRSIEPESQSINLDPFPAEKGHERMGFLQLGLAFSYSICEKKGS